jgi:hypothetical protein
VADGVEIAQRASDPDAKWAPCVLCHARRRLDDLDLCHACGIDPIKRELIELRNSMNELRQDLVTSRQMHRHLKETHLRSVRKLRVLQRDRTERTALFDAHFALPLTEDEYHHLVAIMIDARDDGPTIPVLSICRKLDIP